MEDLKLEVYWHDIPIGKSNAVSYTELVEKWGRNERAVRAILHELSLLDNGDNYILIRSSSTSGFYRTDDAEELKAFKRECLNKGKSLFAPVKKINRVLQADAEQLTFENNLRLYREEAGLTQAAVCEYMKQYDGVFDKSLLSKMENSACLPTPLQLLRLSFIYACKPNDLIKNLY